jgi:hypothetical protein
VLATAGRVRAARISTDEPIAAGRLDEDRDEQRGIDSLARRDADSKHELLGDAVEERTEGELGAAVSSAAASLPRRRGRASIRLSAK